MYKADAVHLDFFVKFVTCNIIVYSNNGFESAATSKHTKTDYKSIFKHAVNKAVHVQITWWKVAKLNR